MQEESSTQEHAAAQRTLKASTKHLTILLAILCLILGGLYLNTMQRASKLNDALYIANGTIDRLRRERDTLQDELDKTKRELEALKADLQYEKQKNDSLQQDYDDYVNEAENYIDYLEIENEYRKPMYYGY